MADIIQAAKWMQEGKRVRRVNYAVGEGFFVRLKNCGYDDGRGWIAYFSDYLPPSGVPREHPYSDLLTTEDLLATDWEAVEEAK